MPTDEQTTQDAMSIHDDVKQAEECLRNAQAKLERHGGSAAEKALGAVKEALAKAKEAAKTVAMAFGLTAALVMGADAQADRFMDAEGEEVQVYNALAAAPGSPGDWGLDVKQNRMDGVVEVEAVGMSQPEDHGRFANLMVSCQLGEQAPAITILLEGDGSAIQRRGGTLRMKFDGQSPFDQRVFGGPVMDDGDGNTLRAAVIGAVGDEPGYGKSEFLKAMDDSQSLLIEVDDDQYHQFDLNHRNLRVAIDRIQSICPMHDANRMAHLQEAAEQSYDYDRRERMEQMDRGEYRIAMDRHERRLLDRGLNECYRGAVSREGSRWAGAAVGALATRALASGDSRSKNRATIGGAVLGGILGSTVDRKLQDRRTAGQVGETREYRARDNRGQVVTYSFMTLADGAGCIVKTNEYGEQVGKARRVKMEKFTQMENNLRQAVQRVRDSREPRRDYAYSR